MESFMTVYEKLFNARKEATNSVFEKNTEGFNYNYIDYPELKEKTHKILEQNELLLLISFETDCVAKLIYVKDATNFIEFHAPIQYPKKKNVNLSKNKEQPCWVEEDTDSKDIGAMMTYMRRYMLLLVLDIAPKDELDAEQKEPSASYNIQTLSAIEEAMQGKQNDKNLTAQNIFDFLNQHNWQLSFINNEGKNITYKIKTQQQLEKKVETWLKFGLK